MFKRFLPAVKTITGQVVSGARARPLNPVKPAYVKAYEELCPKYQYPFGVSRTELYTVRWIPTRGKHGAVYGKRIYHSDGRYHEETYLWLYDRGQMVELLQDGVPGGRRRFVGF